MTAMHGPLQGMPLAIDNRWGVRARTRAVWCRQ